MGSNRIGPAAGCTASTHSADSTRERSEASNHCESDEAVVVAVAPVPHNRMAVACSSDVIRREHWVASTQAFVWGRREERRENGKESSEKRENEK